LGRGGSTGAVPGHRVRVQSEFTPRASPWSSEVPRTRTSGFGTRNLRRVATLAGDQSDGSCEALIAGRGFIFLGLNNRDVRGRHLTVRCRPTRRKLQRGDTTALRMNEAPDGPVEKSGGGWGVGGCPRRGGGEPRHRNRRDRHVPGRRRRSAQRFLFQAKARVISGGQPCQEREFWTFA